MGTFTLRTGNLDAVAGPIPTAATTTVWYKTRSCPCSIAGYDSRPLLLLAQVGIAAAAALLQATVT